MRQPTSWLHQLLGAAIMLAVSAWLVSWAVNLLVPVLPGLVAVLVLLATVVGGVRLVLARRREW